MPITILDDPLDKISRDIPARSEDMIRVSVRHYPFIIIPLESVRGMAYIG